MLICLVLKILMISYAVHVYKAEIFSEERWNTGICFLRSVKILSINSEIDP